MDGSGTKNSRISKYAKSVRDLHSWPSVKISEDNQAHCGFMKPLGGKK